MTTDQQFILFVGEFNRPMDGFQRADTLSEIIPALTQPTFIPIEYTYLVRGTKAVLKELETFDVDKIVNGGLVIHVDSIDKRSKVYKKYKKYIHTENSSNTPVDPTHALSNSLIELNPNAILQVEELLSTGENGVKLLRMLYYSFVEVATILDAPWKYYNKSKANTVTKSCALSLEQVLDCIRLIVSADNAVMSGERSADDAIKVTILTIMDKRNDF